MANAPAARAIINNEVSSENLLSEKFMQHIQESKKEIIAFFTCNLAFAAILYYCYPYPDTTTDTGGYIRWAIEDLYGGPRPLGYSVFLLWLHSLSEGTFIVFFIQFLAFTLSQLFFYLTCTYHFEIHNKPLRLSFLTIFTCFISGIYTTNMVLSDNLFLSLTTLLISFSIWFIRRQSIFIFCSIIVCCMLCITVRYTGLLYPLIIAILFFLSLKKHLATAATILTVIVVIAYTNHVSSRTEEDLEVKVFSAFGGWQNANNALHILPHLDLGKRIIETDDADLQYVDDILRTSYPVLKTKYPGKDEVSYDFIWSDSLPLRQILYRKMESTKWSYYHTWNYTGVVFNNYANELIKKYPALYFRYFICNNAKRLFYPDNEVLIRYNFTGTPGQFEQDWFKWKNPEQIKPEHDLFRPLLHTLPFTYSIFWLVYICCLCLYVYMLCKKIITRRYVRASLLIAVFILVYGIANIAAAPVNTRFLMPIRSCIIVFVVVCVNAYIHYKERQN